MIESRFFKRKPLISEPRIIQDILPPSKKPEFGSSTPTRKKVSARPETPFAETQAHPPAPLDVTKPQKLESQPTAPPHESLPTEVAFPVRTWEPDALKRQRRKARMAIWSIAAILVIGFTLPLVAFPTVRIEIEPQVQTVPVPETSVEANTVTLSPDAALGKVPALLLTINAQVSTESRASGQKYIETFARGQLTITNAFSSTPQPLVAGTRFRAPGGEIFKLTKAVLVPGARVENGQIIPASISVEAAASLAGETYNLGPTEFRLPAFIGTPKYEKITAKSNEPFSGGFKGLAQVVSSGDLSPAEEKATAELVDTLKRSLAAKIPSDPDFLALDGARETVVTNIAAPKVGDRADTFQVTASGEGRLMLIRKSHLAQFLTIRLASSDPLASPTRSENDLVFTQLKPDFGHGRMAFQVGGDFHYYENIVLADIEATIRNSTFAKAEAYLRGRPEISAFRIRRFPVWLWFIPQRAGGLRLNLQAPAGPANQ